MNKHKMMSLVIALVLLLPCLVLAGLPGAHDPTSGRFYTCKSCHTTGATIGSSDTGKTGVATNICARCHAGGAAVTQAKNQIIMEDYANPFGTSTIGQPLMQSSHKWFGPVNVPAAGAQAPIDPAPKGMNYYKFPQDKLSCARCHSIHGTSGTTSTVSPYLRFPNDKDQLCMNCHRKRDVKDHRLGSHPVNVSYTSASVKAKGAKFLASPVTNPLNSTGQVKLKNGLVVCSTCHGVHNTDSRTSTFDPFSSTQVFGKLSSSKGSLLRVDAYGKTADDVNICTNCHADKKNHNVDPVHQAETGGTKAVQCNDCHSAHVEYDAAAVPLSPEATPNNNLVRRYLQYSTAGRPSKRVFYRYTGGTTKEYYNAAGKGVCQACHFPPLDHYENDVRTGTFPDVAHAKCSSCHNHSEKTGAKGSFSYAVGTNCDTSCHGYPPANALTDGTGEAPGYATFNEANTPHASHASGTDVNYRFSCDQCHHGYNMSNGLFNDVFKTYSAVVLAGSGATYTANTFTCNTVYCHSNGKGSYKTVTWGENKGSIIGNVDQNVRCATCHNTTTISTGSHSRHVAAKGYGCVTCHAATVSNNTTLLDAARIAEGTHVNKVADVQYSGVSPAIGTTCANVACHSNSLGSVPVITPSWGVASSGACGACHYTNLTAPALSTGAHTKHFNQIFVQFASTDPLVVCAKCHIYDGGASHVNGTLNVTTGCSVCHQDPYGPTFTTPNWYSSSPGCGACHNNGGAFVVGIGYAPATGTHSKHMVIPGALCNQCHTGTVANSVAGTYHTDGDVDVTQGYPTNVAKHLAGTYTGTCSTTCHSSTSVAVATPTWGATATCASCHATSPTTGAHSKHMAAVGALCNQCHTGAVMGSNAGSNHFDNDIDVSVSGYPANIAKHAAGTYTGTCSTLCHSATNVAVTTPTWAATATCVSCHGVTSPTTGTHTRHMALAGALCNQCHAGAVLGSNGGSAHIDGDIDVTGGYPANVAKHAVATYTGACSTAVCHGSIPSPTWGVNTATAFCTKCHGTPTATVTAANRQYVSPVGGTLTGTGQVSNDLQVGAHSTHLMLLNGFNNYSTVDYRCQACHGTIPADNTYSHANSSSVPAFPVSNIATKWGGMTPTYSGGTCTNTYCHNPAASGIINAANNGSGISPSWTNAAYIADGTKKTQTNCGTCHKSPGDIGFTSGTAHVANVTQDCSGCHGHNGETSGSLGQRHMDGKFYGNGSCDTCHGYPPVGSMSGIGVVGNYENAKINTYTGVNDKHMAHLSPSITSGEGFTPCLPCHPNEGAGFHKQGGSTVIKANVTVNIAADTGYRFDSSRSKRYNPTTKICSNVSCHFQPTPAWY